MVCDNSSESFIQVVKPSILLYIICHDSKSEENATRFSLKVANEQAKVRAVPFRVSDSSPYFESQVFETMDLSKNIEYEWVGVITSSFESKMGINVPCIQKQVEDGELSGASVISLFNLDFVKPRVNRSVSFIESIAMQHGPYIWMAIHYLFKLQGFKEDEIMNQEIKGFFSNWWIAKPHVMKLYVEFFKRCQKIVDVHPLVSSYVNQDSYYLGYGHKQSVENEKIKKIFGRDYYCLHPFLFERLPPIFFHIMKFKVYRGGVTYVWNLGD